MAKHEHDWVYDRTETIRNTLYYVYKCANGCGQEKKEPALWA